MVVGIRRAGDAFPYPIDAPGTGAPHRGYPDATVCASEAADTDYRNKRHPTYNAPTNVAQLW